jgi:NAD(P)-dependent dehydrogenase (short-subunit alcohol dehydrogenase family)
MENNVSRRAVVIGASSGIGRAATELLAAQGYMTIAIGRDDAKLAELARALSAHGHHEVVTRAADASDASAIAHALEAFAPIGHLILTLSGARGGGPFASLDLTDLRAGFEGKFWPQVTALRAALPFLQRDASITFVTAVSAGSSVPGTAGLAAINGALDAMVPVLAVELAPMRVNAVSPGIVETPWWSGFPAETKKQMFAEYAQSAPAGRIGQPAEVAHAIAFLMENRFVTGDVMKIDGGYRLA